MSNYKQRMQWCKKFLVILPILLVVLFALYYIYIVQFNKKERTAVGCVESAETYMDISARTGAGDTWPKRDFDLNGEKVDLTAMTFDGDLNNNASYEVQNWKMTLNITGDCWLTKAWNGTVEIHQGVDSGDEKVQELNLLDFNVEDVTLDYVVFDGDIMIPLTAGDYIVYTPSKESDEYPIAKGKTRTIGFIFEYLESVDLSNFTVKYVYHRTLMDGPMIYILMGLGILWVTLEALYGVSLLSYKTAQREFEGKKSGMLSMSDIYTVIYIVDLVKDEIIPVTASEESEKLRPKDIGANDQFKKMFEMFSTEAYKDIMLEFADLTTLPERMNDRNTIAIDYQSDPYGWCRVRFFAMDRKPNQPLEKVVFTIQEINKEKEELESIHKRVDVAEMESKSKSTFLANMSHEIRTPINTVLGLDTMIIRESNEKQTIAYARDIKSAANMLLSLINGILDFSKLEAGKMELVPEEYSLRQALYEVRSLVKARFDAKNLSIEFNVAENIPNCLYGDQVRIKQVLINLLTNAAKYTDRGGAKISFFGKTLDGKVHLLVSVKDTGIGIHKEDQNRLAERFRRVDEKHNHKIEGTGIGLNLVAGLLELMDSELKVISNYGEGSEFYFEIEQEVRGEELIGKLDFSEAEEVSEDYEASFTAPEVCILAVDDNPLNLVVIENLLKETQVKIERANSGLEALEKTAAKKYDLIYMDHMMPDIDGVETFRCMKADSKNPNVDTPVLILTANALKGAEEEYKEIGFDDFIPKPIQPEILEEKTMKHLDPSKYTENRSGSGKKKEQAASLPSFDGVDVAYGLSHTGGYDSLMRVMEQFAKVAGADAQELEGYYEEIKAKADQNPSLANFRVKVHAMKSSARVMGAIMVSGLAESLEDAARNENADMVLRLTPCFLDYWNSLSSQISSYFEELAKAAEGEEKPRIEQEVLEDLLHQLTTAMNSYDVKASDAILKNLSDYDIEAEKKPAFDKLKTAVANLDAEAIAGLCEEILA